MNFRLKPLTTTRTLLAVTLASMMGAVNAADLGTEAKLVPVVGDIKVIDAVAEADPLYSTSASSLHLNDD